MDIKNVLSYLKESLEDIPAKADNLIVTDYRDLFYCLDKGGVYGESPRRNSYYTEFDTIRNSHKVTDFDADMFSGNRNVIINLFTDRILAAHRETKKYPLGNDAVFASSYKPEHRVTTERFRITQPIPIDPKFMSITLDILPKGQQKNFCRKNAERYLVLMKKYKDVFTKNKIFEEFMRRLANSDFK